MSATYLNALLGGALIGLASVLLLLCNGEILGISGIAGGVMGGERKPWRWFFLAGLATGGLLVLVTVPEAFEVAIVRSPGALVAAGLLVGYGTRLGGGCTSGHGVCGVSRLSPRSIVATLTFMAFGALTVFVVNHLLGGRI